MEKAEKILAIAQIAAGLIEAAAQVSGLLRNIDAVSDEDIKALAAESRAAREQAEARLLGLVSTTEKES